MDDFFDDDDIDFNDFYDDTVNSSLFSSVSDADSKIKDHDRNNYLGSYGW